MLKSHEKFHSANGKRRILVVDDEIINRELLGNVLQSEYEVLFAENGRQGLETARQNAATLSLILLDLIMPVMTGTEMLLRLKENAALSRIPVIVLTSDQTAEIESLDQGAIDFIPKPYPQAGVILARIRRTIELSEDRDIISSTERDPLTGLYNREFFYRYAEQFDQFHPEMEMDAIVLDIYHFHMLNERFGAAYGDALLRQIGDAVRNMVQESGGIVCRREADTFLVYCPHREDYEAILAGASGGLAQDDAEENRVRLRMGVYSGVDKSIDIERRFDRAKNAADTVRSSVTRTIAIYDSALHDQELYKEQLVEDFPKALREEQFKVFFQPKFDVRPDVPFLSSAEALVRWVHPQLGMISPGVFIPLFEENGLIHELDIYVWEHTAAQIREWRERLGFVIPVSVNVSRIDMYDPRLIDIFLRILSEYGVSPSEFLLEITESAYTQDSLQIIETIKKLRQIGFHIEMDDFGTGYSSLNMLSSLPIDALKLDMQFIRTAFSQRRDTRMLEVIIEIADYLSVPVIAEGVETEEQLTALKSMGCDIVQGYYFSRPVPKEEFEPFLLERIRYDREASPDQTRRSPWSTARKEAAAYSSIAQALARDYFSIYYVNTETNRFIEYSSHEEYRELNIEKAGDDFFVLSADNIRRVVHPEDQARVLAAVEKSALMNALRENDSFTLTYRLLFSGQPTFVHLKASRMENKTDPHIVIGVSSIDAQIKREQEQERQLAYARELANRDALTGVRSRLSFLDAEERWNASILEDAAGAFAVAVCDVNGLKEVNDTLGHKAGDQYIRLASSIICDIFRHSPVYRVGGDEFVAILTGLDYDSRDALLEELQEINRQHILSHQVTIACGIDAFDPAADRQFTAVFDRADEKMYENKKSLKGTNNI